MLQNSVPRVERPLQRKLAAILAADIVGYSHLMEADEAGTLARLKSAREQLIEPKIAAFGGRVVNLIGDGMLVEFPSVVDAVTCATEIQHAMNQHIAELPPQERLALRMGINLGDVMLDGEDIYGDGVNIAARLESLCEPGGVLISGTAFDQVEQKLDVTFEFLGSQWVKNIETPVRLYRVPVGVDSSRRARVAGSDAYRPFLLAAIAAVLLLFAGAMLVWRELRSDSAPKTELALTRNMTLPLPDKPSVAVLPFTNMSSDNEQHFAEGMTDDLITDLSKVAGLFVIARNSTFVYQGKPVRIAQVAQDLSVRYVLEGSVQRAGDQVRVNAQLIDAMTGGHIWTGRFNGNMRDIFSVQDEFVRKIVAGLQVKLTKQEKQVIASTKTSSIAAKDAFDEGWSLVLRFNAKDNAAAIEPLKRAVELDPEYGRAYAALALVYVRDNLYGWLQVSGRRGGWATDDVALQYLSLAKRYPTSLTHIVEAQQLLYEGRGAEARAEAGQAIAQSPNDPEAYITMAWGLTIGGKPEEALNFISAAMRLNPNHPSHYALARAIALFAAADLKLAAEVLDEGFRRNPQAAMLLPPLASVLALLGQRQEAMQTLQIWQPRRSQLELEKMTDTYFFPFNWEQEHATVRERLFDGLRIAGLPLEVTVSSLIAELQSDDPFRRLITAKRLGWFGQAAATAVPALIAALQDEAVREEAVKSLGKIGPDAKAAVPALTAIQNESLIGSYAKDAIAQIGRK
jgi:adenylate cyclase